MGYLRISVRVDDDATGATTLDDAIRALLRARRSIPQQYRSEAQLEIYSHDDFGRDPATIECFYVRPETEREIIERADRHAKQVQQQRVLEYQQFLALQAKFAKKDEAS